MDHSRICCCHCHHLSSESKITHYMVRSTQLVLSKNKRKQSLLTIFLSWRIARPRRNTSPRFNAMCTNVSCMRKMSLVQMSANTLCASGMNSTSTLSDISAAKKRRKWGTPGSTHDRKLVGDANHSLGDA